MFDYVFVGGGLQTALMVLALRAHRPGARIALVERGPRLGGNHTWSFHEGDLTPSARAWVAPLVVARWERTEVAFPRLHRRLEQGYASISSERLDRVVGEALRETAGSQAFLEAEAETLAPKRVTLRDGRVLEGRLVVDGRGPEALAPASGCGYQKFLGLELALAHKTPLAHPLVMDARVEQTDGYRFVYVLPFTDDRVLVEDTYYSDDPTLDLPLLRARVRAYAEAQGWTVRETLREETGLLPIPWSEAPAMPGLGVLRAGYAGGFFHPTTGYSLPVAARIAEHLASCEPEEAQGPGFARLRREHARQARFCRILNWLLFCAYPPGERFRVLERFYRLPEATIGRFYAMQLTLGDRARLLVGRPPGGLSLVSAFRRLQAAA